jgi:glycerophosphoryl diester phosphodiesterase
MDPGAHTRPVLHPRPVVHPHSVLAAPGGRRVLLKVHRCRWSGRFPANSLAAALECARERVAHAEVDIQLLRDADFLVSHDDDLAESTTGQGPAVETTRHAAERLRFRTGDDGLLHRPALLSELLDELAPLRPVTRFELDAKDPLPWPWPRVEELARLVQPHHGWLVFGSMADWNLRRLLEVDPTIPVSFNPGFYLDWRPAEEPEQPPHRTGAYGYLDDHPLAARRHGPTADYLRDRFGALLRLVPGSRALHLRLTAFERMLDDGLTHLADRVHATGQELDVWTLNAGAANWRERLMRAVAAGADIVTTDTAAALAAAASDVQSGATRGA